jgi:predicted enzyme related to lactoylglutathione lyase
MSKDQKGQRPKTGHFAWNELVTTNVAAARKFYSGMLGWKTQPFGKGMEYTLFKSGKDMVGGVMKCQQPGVPAHWIPYVLVDKVDAIAKKGAKLKGKVLVAPRNIPGVGRIAVLLDPQGAAIGIFTPAQGQGM